SRDCGSDVCASELKAALNRSTVEFGDRVTDLLRGAFTQNGLQAQKILSPSPLTLSHKGRGELRSSSSSFLLPVNPVHVPFSLSLLSPLLPTPLCSVQRTHAQRNSSCAIELPVSSDNVACDALLLPGIARHRALRWQLFKRRRAHEETTAAGPGDRLRCVAVCCIVRPGSRRGHAYRAARSRFPAPHYRSSRTGHTHGRILHAECRESRSAGVLHHAPGSASGRNR